MEQHSRAVLTMPLDARIADEKTQSWVRWYQVIVLADQGNERTGREKTFDALREDARLNDLKHGDRRLRRNMVGCHHHRHRRLRRPLSFAGHGDSHPGVVATLGGPSREGARRGATGDGSSTWRTRLASSAAKTPCAAGTAATIAKIE